MLGPLEVVVDDGRPLDLGSARERALLALLALHANEALPVERIVDELWPEDPPETATKIVQVYVSRLRKALGAERDVLATRGAGYALVIDRSSTDVGRCEELVRRARGLEASGRAALLREALGLWRGSPLDGLTAEPFAAFEAARLREWELAIREERIAADLELGAGSELVVELDGLVRTHPLRERLREQQMLALYRAGRQADALASFRDLRTRLDEELGLEPRSALRELERAILRQDPSLLPGAADTHDAPSAPAVVVVASRDGQLDGTAAVAESLANVDRERELVLVRIVEAAELAEATRTLAARRDELAGRGVAARVAAFTSVDPGGDLARLSAAEPSDLVLVGVGPDVLDDAIVTLLDRTSCDVALHVVASEPAEGPVLVPFGAGKHDWAALEVGAWLARGTGTTLRLVGATSDDPAVGDASRLLADASLVVQRATGVVAEPALSRPGAAIAEVAREAGSVVVGLPTSWRESGLGPVRTALATAPPGRLLFVHRGSRPTSVAERGDASSFAWSAEHSRSSSAG
jgi:DNA-binding SARP family transcriptional activator